MPQFRKKPIIIEAMRWNGRNNQEITDFMGGVSNRPFSVDKPITIATLEGDMKASVGDFIIKGVRGEFYPCKPDIFKMTYDAMGEENRKKVTVAVDFDGVIHAYSKGWLDGTCYDEPMKGAEKGLRALMERYNVFILSTRDPQQIQSWMADHFQIATQIITKDSPFWNTSGVIGITNRKLAAIAYIDDRAVLFENWDLVKNINKRKKS